MPIPLRRQAPEPVFELALDLPPRRSRTLLKALHRQMREAILTGRLQPGLKVPSTRAFAARYGVSRNTATTLYDMLLGEGFLVARHGAGTFVAAAAQRVETPPAAPPKPDPRLPRRAARIDAIPHVFSRRPLAVNLRVGLPDQSGIAFDVWRRLSNRVLRAYAQAPVMLFDPAGPEALRTAICGHVSFTRAVACAPEDLIVTAGAQQGFDIVARTLVVPGETVVAFEDPGYPPARSAFAAAGAIIYPVPVDASGIRVDALPAAARIVFVTPSHQFPTGVTMPAERRQELLEWAARREAVIVEDDYDGEFRFGGRPHDALQTLDRSGSVIYVGTFSKSLFPALRIGFVAAPPWAREALLRAKQVTDWHASGLPQLTLAAFIEEGHLAAHIRRMRRIYAERREALLDALAAHCRAWFEVIESNTGLHIAGWLPPGLSPRAVTRAATAEGIAIDRLDWYALDPERGRGVAFGYGLCEPGRIASAIAALGAAMRGAAAA